MTTEELHAAWERMAPDSLKGELELYEGTPRGDALAEWIANREGDEG